MSVVGEADVVDPPRRRSAPASLPESSPPAGASPATGETTPGEGTGAVSGVIDTSGRNTRRRRRLSASVRRIVEALPRLDGGEALAPSERIELIAIVGARLCLALTILLLVMGGGAYLAFSGGGHVAGGTVAAVLLTGAVGGFVSLQKRLKSLGTDDLILLANSWVYIVLSPLVGGVLAILLYVLFISGLVDGDLFPTIVADRVGFGPGGTSAAALQTSEVARAAVAAAENAAFARQAAAGSLSDLFGVYAASPADYAKILFWCFLAGYSERFVTNIISQFETGMGQGPGHAPARVPEQGSRQVAGQRPGQAPERTSERASERASERTISGQASGRAGAPASEPSAERADAGDR